MAPPARGYVYVIGSPGSSVVKIGHTTRLKQRLADIQRMSPAKLTVLWKTEGGTDLEASLHRTFADYRSHYEWFDFGDLNVIELVEEAVRNPAPPPTRQARSARKPKPAKPPRAAKARVSVDGWPDFFYMCGFDDLGYDRWFRPTGGE